MNESIQLEDVPCALGCDYNDKIVLTGHDRLHDLPGEFNVVKCQSCGLMRTNPRPTSDSIGFYYPSDYGPYLSTQVHLTKTKKKIGIKNILRPFIRRVFNTKADILPVLPTGRLLEIGCASGSFLYKMANKGWQVEGIEFSEKAAQEARQLGYQVYTGSLEDSPIPEQPFDLIVGWMVLEHLSNPTESLKKLHQCAKFGAWLALSVPDAGSLEFKVFKDKWYALQLPNHLYHFTPKTLAKVLKVSGWTLVKIHHQRNLNNLLVSMAYSFEEKGWQKLGSWFRAISGSSGVWFYVKFPLAWLYGISKQSGRMTIWARKD